MLVFSLSLEAGFGHGHWYGLVIIHFVSKGHANVQRVASAKDLFGLGN